MVEWQTSLRKEAKFSRRVLCRVLCSGLRSLPNEHPVKISMHLINILGHLALLV